MAWCSIKAQQDSNLYKWSVTVECFFEV